MRVAMMAALAGAIAFAGPAFAADKVTFGTNWVADPEAGGYYQALVDGTYAKYGLDVTILQGGPMSNGGMLLIAGKIEFFMGGDMIGDFLAVQNNIPTIAVAAHFQKNPQIFMSHPGVGLDKWQDLPNANPAFVSAGAVNTFWAWMRLAYGFKDENIKPYNFNSAPFIAEPRSIQQGYLTSEPLEVEKQGGFKPNVFLLADYGYSTYSTIWSKPAAIFWRSILISSSASSTPPPSAGTTISMATTPRPMRRSNGRIRKSRTTRSPSRSAK